MTKNSQVFKSRYGVETVLCFSFLFSIHSQKNPLNYFYLKFKMTLGGIVTNKSDLRKVWPFYKVKFSYPVCKH